VNRGTHAVAKSPRDGGGIRVTVDSAKLALGGDSHGNLQKGRRQTQQVGVMLAVFERVWPPVGVALILMTTVAWEAFSDMGLRGSCRSRGCDSPSRQRGD